MLLFLLSARSLLNWLRMFSYTVSRWCGKPSVPLWWKMCSIPDLGFLLSSHFIPFLILIMSHYLLIQGMEFVCLNVWESWIWMWRHIKIKYLFQLLSFVFKSRFCIKVYLFYVSIFSLWMSPSTMHPSLACYQSVGVVIGLGGTSSGNSAESAWSLPAPLEPDFIIIELMHFLVRNCLQRQRV